jgi:hypothetical protein
VNVENTRVRRGSRLAALIIPVITLPSAAGSWPSQVDHGISIWRSDAAS